MNCVRLGYCGRKMNLINEFILAKHKPRVMSSSFEASSLVLRLSPYWDFFGTPSDHIWMRG